MHLTFNTASSHKLFTRNRILPAAAVIAIAAGLFCLGFPAYRSALMQDAIHAGDEEGLKHALALGASPNEILNEPYASQRMPLDDLLRKFRGERQTPEPAIIASVGHQGCTPLENRKEMVEILVNAGADINVRSSSGETALAIVAGASEPDLIDYMINKGAHR